MVKELERRRKAAQPAHYGKGGAACSSAFTATSARPAAYHSREKSFKPLGLPVSSLPSMELVFVSERS
jgi:hypothetical protein